MSAARSLIVVPDGLAADPQGRALPEPSFAYRWVLDWVIANRAPEDAVLLAPANRFGGDVSEQEAARRYLAARGVSAPLVCFEADTGSYIDTRGNAALLRRYLEAEGRWPPDRATLVSYAPHLERARIVFEQEGYRLEACVAVAPPHFAPEPIVGRLWYYRVPLLHRLYEAGARLASRLRWI